MSDDDGWTWANEELPIVTNEQKKTQLRLAASFFIAHY